MATLLQVQGVTVTRTGKAGGITLLDEVSFEARSGLVTAIIGPSGGGKSTLARLLNRLDDPARGRILLDGRDTAGDNPLLLRRQVALLGQKPIMFAGTVLDNLQAPFLLQGLKAPDPTSSEWPELLALAGLESKLMEREAASLSLGQQQRVSLARALATQPEVLVLDEPTSALDRPSGDRLGETLRRLARERGLIVVLVTHDLRLVERVADWLVFLEGGRVLEQGAARPLLRAPHSEQLRGFLAEPVAAGEGS